MYWHKGDPIVVLEAMKMENVLKALAEVTVKSIQAEPAKPWKKMPYWCVLE